MANRQVTSFISGISINMWTKAPAQCFIIHTMSHIDSECKRHFILRIFCIIMLDGLGIIQSCWSCRIRMLDSCMSIIQSRTAPWDHYLLCLMTEATQMCMAYWDSTKYIAVCVHLYGFIHDLLYICYMHNQRLLNNLQVLRSSAGRGHNVQYKTWFSQNTSSGAESIAFQNKK